MTTAHRPTWNSAVGSAGTMQGGYTTAGAISRQYSSRDLPSELTLKTRQPGQTSAGDVAKRDLKKELEAAEAKHFADVQREKDKAAGVPVLDDATIAAKALRDKETGADSSDDDDDDLGDLSKFDDADDVDSDSDADSDDDEDEEAELMRELEKIKRERAEEKARKEEEERQAEAKQREGAILASNPLLGLGAGGGAGGSARVKRRWDDDVVFKNQARGEKKARKRFINDVIRSDFHRRFLGKYIK